MEVGEKMALEVLKDVKEIGGYEVAHVEFLAKEEDFRKHIIVNHGTNFIGFKIQNGPIKEVGVNGAQIEVLIEAAKLLIERHNELFPCIENVKAVEGLKDALAAIIMRKAKRLERGVEGEAKV